MKIGANGNLLRAVCASVMVVGVSMAWGDDLTLPTLTDAGGQPIVPAFHFDASQTETMTTETKNNDITYVSEWRHASNSSADAYKAVATGGKPGNKLARPMLVEYPKDEEMTVVDFGPLCYLDVTAQYAEIADGVGAHLEFYQSTSRKDYYSVREVFMVVSDRPDWRERGRCNFFLGGWEAYNFHRGSDNTLFNGQYSVFGPNHPNVVIEVDGDSVSYDSVFPTGFHLLHLRTDGNVIASTLCADRGGIFGGLIYGEVLIFGTTLSDEQSAAVSDYLMQKWSLISFERSLTVQIPSVEQVSMPQVSPAPSESGFYPLNTEVTITADDSEVPFVRWYGDVPEGHETDNPLTITMDRDKVITPYFRTQWNFTTAERNFISNGYWTMPVELDPDEGGAMLRLCTPTVPGMIPSIDFSSGLVDGVISSVVDSWLGNAPGDVRSLSQEVILPSTLRTIGNNAFLGLIQLKSVVVPEGLRRIGSQAFDNCSSLESITPATFTALTNLGYFAFNECAKLTNDFVFTNRKLTIDYYEGAEVVAGLFRASGVRSIDLFQTNAKILNRELARNCPNLRSVRYPRNMTQLGHAMHYNNLALLDVQFGVYPENFNELSDLFGATRDHRWGARIVYDPHDPGWINYLATEQANGNFTAWENATPDEQSIYLDTHPDQWQPIGYLTVHAGMPYGNVSKWFVPRSFDQGLVIILR